MLYRSLSLSTLVALLVGYAPSVQAMLSKEQKPTKELIQQNIPTPQRQATTINNQQQELARQEHIRQLQAKALREIQEELKQKTAQQLQIEALQGGLKEALMHNNIAFLNSFIQSGADINYTYENNVTPLHMAAVKGYYDILKLLLERKANPTAKTLHGQTPLHFACFSNGNSQIISLLINKKAEVNIQDNDGNTALHAASEFGNLDAVKLLVTAEANQNISSKKGITPLYQACSHGHVNIAKFLCDSEADINIATIDKSTPLHAACQKGYLDIAKILLAHGANIKAQTLLQWTPLHFASY
jgi:ankyrin repeat protein